MTNETSTTTETAAVAEQGANVAPEKAASTKKASSKKSAPKGQKAAKKAAAKKEAKPATKKAAKKETKPAAREKATAKASAPREGSKKQIVIEMMRRKEGATMAEIAKATAWQNHTIRGFVAGTLKKMGITAESTKNASGERCYSIK
ncbi:MAG TPA: DUF3489 domain-containing protein [Gemmataceae bacterium]|nr:DUF3489 domain-containing protein [Bryobacteraceae bacterium]HZV05707.1 DUF3489 domain-containing protein [Gemmataceae bacterium]